MKKRIFSFLLVVMMMVTMLPMTAFATETEMSDTFKQILTDGKLVVPAVEPEDEFEGYAYVNWYLSRFYTMDSDYEFWFGSFEDENYEKGSVDCYDYETGENESHIVEIVWKENNDAIKNKVKAYSDKVKVASEEEDGQTFLVKDLEVINYWVNGNDPTNSLLDVMINYSGEFKTFLNNSNISVSFNTGTGMGDDTQWFLTTALGDSVFIYDGIAYVQTGAFGARVEHAIYVPDETGDTKEELLAAAQKRIDAYVGAGIVQITYGGDDVEAVYQEGLTFIEETENFYNEQILFEESEIERYNESKENATSDDELAFIEQCILQCENNIAMYEYWIEDIPRQKAAYAEEYGFELEAAGGYWFTAEVNDFEYKFVIIKDSEGMINPNYQSADIDTEIVVSTTDASVPLDTVVAVEELTSGTEYDKIIQLLDVETNQTFDINLYSGTLKDNVTKLDNGTFEVKIPVAETLKDKDLVAYYVDENDKVVEYEVTVEDGYAVFATDHFSIYTIAEKEVVVPEPVPEPEPEPTPEVKPLPEPEVVVPENNAAGSTIDEEADAVVEKVPFTDAEKAEIEAGAEVVITLEVKDITETVSAEDKAKIEAEVKAVKDQKVGMYLDINMFKQVGDNEAVKIPELNSKIKIQLTVPEDLIVKDSKVDRIYSIIRIHDNETTVIEPKFDAMTKKLVFETDSFSTYALVYKDVIKVPATGDDTSFAMWILLLVIGATIVCYGGKRRNYI